MINITDFTPRFSFLWIWPVGRDSGAPTRWEWDGMAYYIVRRDVKMYGIEMS